MKSLILVMVRCAAAATLISAAAAQVDWSAKWIVQNRAYHAMTYDSARQRIVLFGGESYGQVLGDTWEWDGSDWTQVFPAMSPPARAEHAMTYDSARGVVILFSGRDAAGTWTGDLWEWDGVTWVQRGEGEIGPPAVQPFPCSITYDASRGRAVTVVGSLFTNEDDIWEWDGNAWTMALSGFPGGSAAGWAVIGGSVVYDGARQVTVIVVFGLSGAERTYVWDGSTLVEKQAGFAPGALVEDPGRGRIVGYLPVSKWTYEWNGETWTRLFPASSPLDRVAPALAYDGLQDRVVLVGGQDTGGASPAPLFDTWEWDGINWIERVPFPSPPARWGQGVAYDAARAITVLFGGYGGTGLYFGDTWEWTGAAWSKREPAMAPSERMRAALAFSGTENIILFGGNRGSQLLSDTWRWDGMDWVLVEPTQSPSGRYDHALAYDAQRNRVILFGGATASGTAGDTWEWDGDTWAQRFSSESPPARYAHGLAYDSTRGRTIMFGGFAGSYLTDTWEWNGSDWESRPSSTTPPGRVRPGFAFDEARGRAILFGGEQNGLALTDVWEWDGSVWVQRITSQAPPARQGAPLVYESQRRSFLIFGGSANALAVPKLHDTWHYAPTDSASYNTAQAGCPGFGGTPTLTTISPSGYPWLGESFTVAVTNVVPGAPAAMAAGFSNSQWAGIPLPLSLNFIGMFGCQAYCSAEFFFPMPPADPSGTSTWTLGPIPNDPGFLGFRFFTQAWIADSVNPAGLIVSNLGEAVVGGK